jgi:hypothetical protein
MGLLYHNQSTSTSNVSIAYDSKGECLVEYIKTYETVSHSATIEVGFDRKTMALFMRIY